MNTTEKSRIRTLRVALAAALLLAGGGAAAEEIADLIPDSELVVVRGGAHLFMVEQYGAFNRAVLDFLDGTAAAVDRRRISA